MGRPFSLPRLAEAPTGTQNHVRDSEAVREGAWWPQSRSGRQGQPPWDELTDQLPAGLETAGGQQQNVLLYTSYRQIFDTQQVQFWGLFF